MKRRTVATRIEAIYGTPGLSGTLTFSPV